MSRVGVVVVVVGMMSVDADADAVVEGRMGRSSRRFVADLGDLGAEAAVVLVPTGVGLGRGGGRGARGLRGVHHAPVEVGVDGRRGHLGGVFVEGGGGVSEVHGRVLLVHEGGDGGGADSRRSSSSSSGAVRVLAADDPREVGGAEAVVGGEEGGVAQGALHLDLLLHLLHLLHLFHLLQHRVGRLVVADPDPDPDAMVLAVVMRLERIVMVVVMLVAGMGAVESVLRHAHVADHQTSLSWGGIHGVHSIAGEGVGGIRWHYLRREVAAVHRAQTLHPGRQVAHDHARVLMCMCIYI